MNISNAFPSKYIKAADVTKPLQAVMDRVERQDVGGRRDPAEERPVLYFQGGSKGLVLNRTNANTIADAYGHETDTWPGKTIELYASETDFQGRRVPCIRVRSVNGEAAAQTLDSLPF